MNTKTRKRTAIFLQDACHLHRYIRSNDLSAIVERPERLRALKVGFAAALSRIEEASPNTPCDHSFGSSSPAPDNAGEELAAALEKLEIAQEAKVDFADIVVSSSSMDLLNNRAVKFVHGDIDGDVYLENLIKWSKESTNKIKEDGSEIPSHLPQGDLYLCPESLDAIQGALGTVCEAVDKIASVSRLATGEQTSERNSASSDAFVAIRPPGHHCGEDTPSGFCFVNNVVIAAAHAHLVHGIKKAFIFDIDLHHGNGTQSLAWQINEETYRQGLEGEAGVAGSVPGLQIFYGSLHDILSFPCEDGNTSMVQAASVSIHGPHGQHIENIHLEQYESEENFWNDLYPRKYLKLLEKAEHFVKETNGDDVIVFISCGFDACEHEYPSMSRHNRRVPTSFYYRFARDARKFATKYAKGKLISVLEGGYSDRALISGGMAHLSGLIDMEALGAQVDETWWNATNLTLLEKSVKKRRGGKVSVGGTGDKWLERTLAIFRSIDNTIGPSPSKNQIPPPPSSMTLRERKPPSAATTPKGSPRAARGVKEKAPPPSASTISSGPSSPSEESVDDMTKKIEGLDLDKSHVTGVEMAAKKAPRVILHVKDPGNS